MTPFNLTPLERISSKSLFSGDLPKP
jgi:hypothetical protein